MASPDDDHLIEDDGTPDDAPDDATEGDEGPRHVRFTLMREPQARLDKHLQQRIKGVSRNQIQKLIDLGGVTVNDKPVKPSTTLRKGDVIDVFLPPAPPRNLQPEPIPLDILFEDDDFIVINKQAGLIVHPARSNLSGTLLNGLAYHFQQKKQSGADDAKPEASPASPAAHPAQVHGLSSVGVEEARPGIVHRLDKNTTGVMVVAKRDTTHWLIAKQFEDRKTLKAYLALVHGAPDPADAVGGVIDEPIGKHPTIREAMCVRHDSTARASVTLWRVRRRYRGYTLVELELKTGRTHQIRVHLSYIGCPIVGDLLYGGEAVGPAELAEPIVPTQHRRYLAFARNKEEGVAAEAAAVSRPDLLMATPALHAALLSFTHPTTQQTMRFTAPVHRPMIDLLRALEPHRIDGPCAPEGYHVDLDTALAELSA
jgi:23S rRNA pseudouridine1911/1915/1917 synthase